MKVNGSRTSRKTVPAEQPQIPPLPAGPHHRGENADDKSHGGEERVAEAVVKTVPTD